MIARLLVHAEMSASSECDFWTFSRPRGHMPQTYRELQDRVIEHRRQQAAHAADSGGASQLVETSDDLARMLRQFASDGIVVRVLVDFALPPHKRARCIRGAAGAACADGRRCYRARRFEKEDTEATRR